MQQLGAVAELADALDLGSSLARGAGSIPVSPIVLRVVGSCQSSSASPSPWRYSPPIWDFGNPQVRFNLTRMIEMGIIACRSGSRLKNAMPTGIVLPQLPGIAVFAKVHHILTLVAFAAHAVFGCCGHHQHSDSGTCSHDAHSHGAPAVEAAAAHDCHHPGADRSCAESPALVDSAGSCPGDTSELPCKDPSHDCNGARCTFVAKSLNSVEWDSAACNSPANVLATAAMRDDASDRQLFTGWYRAEECRSLGSCQIARCALLQTWQL